jgi:hypothetical protein
MTKDGDSRISGECLIYITENLPALPLILPEDL